MIKLRITVTLLYTTHPIDPLLPTIPRIRFTISTHFIWQYKVKGQFKLIKPVNQVPKLLFVLLPQVLEIHLLALFLMDVFIFVEAHILNVLV